MSKAIRFWKIHGLGNDYILIVDKDQTIKEDKASTIARKLCQRKFSVGADGLLLLSDSDRADVSMKIFNADGSEAEMCGNGIRCLAKYCYENGVVGMKEFVVETLAGLKTVRVIVEDGEVKNVFVNMGKPVFDRGKIPMRGAGRCIYEPLKVDEGEFRITCLSVGNPHCVIFVDDVENVPVRAIGPLIERNTLFPQGVNVGFSQILSRGEIHTRVWERGVGETLACGTGACAAVVAANTLGKVGEKVIVHLLGGDLTIEYGESLSLLGPAEKVFEGTISLE